MDDLSAALGISKKTIYQYYTSKEDLVNDCILEYMNQHNQDIMEVSQSAEDAVGEMLGIAQKLVLVLEILSPKVIYELKKYFGPAWKELNIRKNELAHAILTKNIQNGKSEGLYRQEIKENIIIQLYSTMVMEVINNDFFEHLGFKKSNVYLQLVSYHMHGILTPKGMSLMNTRYKHIIDKLQL
jgi:TetR/AcrR family transcriptional regulator, cholesterol catabolism regulator